MEEGGSRWLYHVGRFAKFVLSIQKSIYVFCYTDDVRPILASQTKKKNFLASNYTGFESRNFIYDSYGFVDRCFFCGF